MAAKHNQHCRAGAKQQLLTLGGYVPSLDPTAWGKLELEEPSTCQRARFNFVS